MHDPTDLGDPTWSEKMRWVLNSCVDGDIARQIVRDASYLADAYARSQGSDSDNRPSLQTTNGEALERLLASDPTPDNLAARQAACEALLVTAGLADLATFAAVPPLSNCVGG